MIYLLKFIHKNNIIDCCFIFRQKNFKKINNHFFPGLILVIAFVLALGTFNDAFASPIVQFKEAAPPNDWYFFKDNSNFHGATVRVDELAWAGNGGTPDTIQLHVWGSDAGCTFTLTETPPDSGVLEFLTHIQFSSTLASSCSIPRIKISTTGSVSAQTISPSSNIDTATFKTGETWGNYGSNSNQPSSTIIDCGVNGDTDTDGICDSFEQSTGLVIPYGGSTYTYNCNSSVPNDCPVVGKKDVYVEIDYMTKHYPNQAARQSVIDSFQAHNVNLHLQVDEDIGYHDFFITAPDAGSGSNTNYDTIKNAKFGKAADRTNANLMTAKMQVFRYALFGHSIYNSGASGLAEIAGNDMLVSLGYWAGGVGSQDEQAGTFMHELGHNLYFDHWGPMAAPAPQNNILCKPNYLSVMNWIYQFSNHGFTRPLDYSSGNSLDLVETGASGLNEADGIGTSNYGKNVVFGPSPAKMNMNDPINPRTVGYGVDWNNQSGKQILDVDVDLNNLSGVDGCPGASSGQTLKDYSDWSYADYDARDTGSWLDGQAATLVPIEEEDENGNEDEESSPQESGLEISGIPEIKLLDAAKQDSSIIFIDSEIKQPENSMDSVETVMPTSPTIDNTCNCPDYSEAIKVHDEWVKRVESSSGVDGIIDVPHSTIKEARDDRIMTVQRVIDAVEKLDNCSFEKTSECTITPGVDKFKKDVIAKLTIVQGLLNEDGFYGANQLLEEVSIMIREEIKDPVVLANLIYLTDGASTTVKASSISEDQYISLKEKLEGTDEIIQALVDAKVRDVFGNNIDDIIDAKIKFLQEYLWQILLAIIIISLIGFGVGFGWTSRSLSNIKKNTDPKGGGFLPESIPEKWIRELEKILGTPDIEKKNSRQALQKD